MSIAVSFQNVNFNYDNNVTILKDISLNIAKGKITAIMGGSGSGKTTLLKLIAGLIKPSSGIVNVLDQDITKLNTSNLFELRKKLSMLFQFGALFTDMTVYDNVAFTLHEHTNLSKRIINKIVAMKLQAVGLSGTQEKFPSELSGGMARRVALARSIALDPSLMLYDEPFTGLDPISLNITANLIKTLNENLNQTSILVTHDVDTTMNIADYIYFVGEGRVLARGTIDEIKNSKDKALQQFLTGSIEGRYQYNATTNYYEYLGVKSAI